MKSKLRLFGNKNQCPGCSDYFNSNWPFDLHRVTRENGKRDCLNEEEMIAKGFFRSVNGFWMGEKMVGYKEVETEE